MKMFVIALLCCVSLVSAFAEGAGQCAAPATKDDLGGMGDRMFEAAADNAKFEIAVVNAAPGEAIKITLTNKQTTGKILGFLVNVDGLTGEFQHGDNSHMPTACDAAPGKLAATHKAKLSVDTVELMFKTDASVAAGTAGTVKAVILFQTDGMTEAAQQMFIYNTAAATAMAPAAPAPAPAPPAANPLPGPAGPSAPSPSSGVATVLAAALPLLAAAVCL